VQGIWQGAKARGLDPASLPGCEQEWAAWAAWFAMHPDRTFWLLSLEGEPAGIVTCDLHPGDKADIVTFGLLPEFVGKGLGGFALTLGVQQAGHSPPR
jgi:RimJ/RimL family protein N-acetyltransferase